MATMLTRLFPRNLGWCQFGSQQTTGAAMRCGLTFQARVGFTVEESSELSSAPQLEYLRPLWAASVASRNFDA